MALTDAEAASLALSAVKDLEGMRVDVNDIKQILLDETAAEIAVPADSDFQGEEVENSDISLLSDDAPDYASDFMSMQWAQTSLLVAILCVLLLRLGVSLWQCFSDKWRS